MNAHEINMKLYERARTLLLDLINRRGNPIELIMIALRQTYRDAQDETVATAKQAIQHYGMR